MTVECESYKGREGGSGREVDKNKDREKERAAGQDLCLLIVSRLMILNA